MKTEILMLHPPLKWTHRRAAAHSRGSLVGSAVYCTTRSNPPQPGACQFTAGPAPASSGARTEEGCANEQQELKEARRSWRGGAGAGPVQPPRAGCRPLGRGGLWVEQEAGGQRQVGPQSQQLDTPPPAHAYLLTCTSTCITAQTFGKWLSGVACGEKSRHLKGWDNKLMVLLAQVMDTWVFVLLFHKLNTYFCTSYVRLFQFPINTINVYVLK